MVGASSAAGRAGKRGLESEAAIEGGVDAQDVEGEAKESPVEWEYAQESGELRVKLPAMGEEAGDQTGRWALTLTWPLALQKADPERDSQLPLSDSDAKSVMYMSASSSQLPSASSSSSSSSSASAADMESAAAMLRERSARREFTEKRNRERGIGSTAWSKEGVREEV